MLLNENYNPYQNIDFSASSEFHAFLQQYAATSGEETAEDGTSSKTFVRQIDGWLLSAALGAQDYSPSDISIELGQSVKFASGQVLKGNVAAISFLGNLAISLSGDVEVVKEPNRVIKIATVCAELGYQRLKEMMNVGSLLPPAVTLVSELKELIDQPTLD